MDGGGLIVDGMDASQARDHIEMVDRILAESSQRLCSGGEYFVVWGLYSAIASVLAQLVVNGILPATALWLQAIPLAAAIVFSVARGRVKGRDVVRFSLMQREFFNVLWLTLGLALLVNLAAFRLFRGWGTAAIWTFAEAVVLCFIGIHGNRRAQIGGLVAAASLVVANFAPASDTGYVLAAGALFGYGGFGVAELLAGD
jgi:hypothetical protein